MAKYKKLKRRKNMRENYFRLHNIDKKANKVEDYELHHIVEFDEFYRLGRFIDEMGNVILIKKKIHIEGTVKKQNKRKLYELVVDPNLTTITLQERGGGHPLTLSITQGDVLVDPSLLHYLKTYNEFLLSKLYNTQPR
ncbi:hypothetical protein [Streptococcus suis]|uniref:Uncharacterized protein n=1 Tax=Streptococcus suis TaxID=1307 RepID=A0A9X4RW53_STRSU|nr:hypothetical protein [Streptococcus suis]MDG4527128.1 hypothetical protein [Streptococcus suis]MDG4529552.1 hypothetical protein [Streptococcus suis]